MDSQQPTQCDTSAAPQCGCLSTIRSHLTSLVLACVLPVWLIAGFLVYYAYASKRALVTEHMLETTRALSMSVDQELATIQAALQALATSPAFDTGDVTAIHNQALALLHGYPKADIIVADRSGQQLVNSYRPLGSQLPKRNNPETVRRIFHDGNPVISDLFFGAVTKRPLIAIDVPVFRKGEVVYDLSMTLPSDRLAAILSHQHLPPEWYCSILDSKTVVVARTRRPERFVGKVVNSPFRQAMARSPEGIVKVVNLEGVAVLDAFSRSAASRWTVVIGAPTSTAMVDLYAWLGWAIGGATVISLLGIALALRIGSRIAQSIRSLVPPALALGSGEPVTDLPPHFISETACLSEAMLQASHILEKRAAERDRAEASLRESETLYRSVVTSMAEGIVLQSANGEITAVNPAAASIEGRSSEEMLGRTSDDQQLGAVYEDGTPFPAELHPSMVALRTGEPQTDVVMGIHRPDGTLVLISVNSQPLIAPGAAIPYAVVTTFHDITKRVRAEEDNRNLNEELEQRVQQRTAELEEKNAELEKMNRLFVGRELRMVELKERIRDLEESAPKEMTVKL